MSCPQTWTCVADFVVLAAALESDSVFLFAVFTYICIVLDVSLTVHLFLSVTVDTLWSQQQKALVVASCWEYFPYIPVYILPTQKLLHCWL